MAQYKVKATIQTEAEMMIEAGSFDEACELAQDSQYKSIIVDTEDEGNEVKILRTWSATKI